MEDLQGVTVHRVRSVPTWVRPTFRVSLPPLPVRVVARVLREHRPDLVHVQDHFLIGRELTRQARRRWIPLLATNHFMPENLLPFVPVPRALHPLLARLAWRDFARVFNRAHLATAPTPTACSLIVDLPLRPPLTPVSCGVDLRRFRLSGRLFVGERESE